MPVTLVVGRWEGASGGDAPLPTLTFDGPRIVLGRSAACDVRLPDASVSGRHASIRAQNAAWVVLDEGSTNGTRLNGERLTPQAPHRIESGDEIVLGRVSVTVRMGAAVASPASATRELAVALVLRALGKEKTPPTVEVVEGADVGATCEIHETPRTVGRDPRCALRLSDKGVPPIALEVGIDGGRVRVVLRDARAEARLGDRPLVLGEPTHWADRGVLTIAATRLRLDDLLSRALERSSDGADEPYVPPKPPPAPPPTPAAETDRQDPEEGDREDPRGADELEPAPPPRYDRRRRWRSATTALEIVALVLGLAVLGLSAAGFWWLLRK